jgi:hypothetical protein
MTSICIDTLSKVAPESRQYREKLRILVDNNHFLDVFWLKVKPEKSSGQYGAKRQVVPYALVRCEHI